MSVIDRRRLLGHGRESLVSGADGRWLRCLQAMPVWT
jgi:hypothetical protein